MVLDTQVIRKAPHRVKPETEAEIDRQVSQLLHQGIIEPTYRAWSSPVVLVKKDQTWRLCVGYRKLNAVTKQNDSLNALFGRRVVSTLDMSSGYLQFFLSPEALKISVFITKNRL